MWASIYPPADALLCQSIGSIITSMGWPGNAIYRCFKVVGLQSGALATDTALNEFGTLKTRNKLSGTLKKKLHLCRIGIWAPTVSQISRIFMTNKHKTLWWNQAYHHLCSRCTGERTAYGKKSTPIPTTSENRDGWIRRLNPTTIAHHTPYSQPCIPTGTSHFFVLLLSQPCPRIALWKDCHGLNYNTGWPKSASDKNFEILLKNYFLLKIFYNHRLYWNCPPPIAWHTSNRRSYSETRVSRYFHLCCESVLWFWFSIRLLGLAC